MCSSARHDVMVASEAVDATIAVLFLAATMATCKEGAVHDAISLAPHHIFVKE